MISSRRVRAQTGHRASGSAQNQLQRRIGRPKETAPGSVLGRKVDRFQPPSGAPGLPQGVPEALRGARLEIFLKMERELLVVSTNATIPNEQLAGFTMPSASTATQSHPTWLQTKASNMLHLQGRTSTQQVQHGLAEEDDDIAAIHREYWRTLPRLSVPEMQFLWPEAHGVSSTQSGAEDESRARCLRLQGLQISELPWL